MAEGHCQARPRHGHGCGEHGLGSCQMGGRNTGGNVSEDPHMFKQAAMRGLKTKIRRLYDCSNVLTNMGIISKVGDTTAMPADQRRPRFQWNFKMSPHEIRELYATLPVSMREKRDPFTKEDLEEIYSKSPKTHKFSPELSLSDLPAHETPIMPPPAASNGNVLEETSSNDPFAHINQAGGAILSSN